jgi:deoxyribonuclease V
MAPIGFFDAAYATDAAGVACVLADRWEADWAVATCVERFALVPQPYQPGELYRRELPLLLSLLRYLDPLPRILVIDGYVWLGDGVPGLGAHLFEAYGETIPVIGVAKSRFRGDTWSAQVLRGASHRPLHVTAAGVELHDAAAWIRGMHGTHRIPALLQEVDRLSRSALTRT